MIIKRSIICLLLTIVVLPSLAATKLPKYKIKKDDIVGLSEEMQQYFAGLQYLLNAYQIRQFLTLENDDQRKEWLDIFWKQRDPTPTTPENEMLTEHTIRAKLARQFYASKKWPGWDKRGEVFIRYGPPDYRGRIWGDVTVKDVRPPREIWYFVGHDMLIAFENFGLMGEYIYAIDPLGSAEKMSPEFAEFVLYETQQSLTQRIPMQYLKYYETPIYSDRPIIDNPIFEQEYLMARPRELAEDIDALMSPDLVDVLPDNVSRIFHKENLREVANNFEITLSETPSSYPFNFDREELPFYFGIDQFKAGDNSNRVDVPIELPLEIVTDGSVSFDETFLTAIVIWDSEYNEVSRKEKSIRVRTGPDVERWSNLLPTQLVFSLDRGSYRMGISVRGVNSGRSSAYRTSFSCEPFRGPLAMSDILFARRIDEAKEASIFTRGALDVVPHPLRAYSRSVPMPLYFEIYNLTKDSGGVVSYTIEYKIIPHSSDKSDFWDRFDKVTPVMSSKFQSSGFSEDEPQHISLITENLRKGSYDLLITLTDDLTQQVAYRKGTFSLID